MDLIKSYAYAIAAALWLTASATGARSQTVDIAAAKKDGKVVVYGSVVPQAMEELHKTFEKNMKSKSNTGAVRLRRWQNVPKTNGAPAGRLSTWSSPAGM